MREDRLLALVGFLLLLAGGLLVLLGGARLPRSLDLADLALRTLVPLTLGIAALVAAIALLRGPYGAPGVVGLLLGILVLLLGGGLAEGLLLILGGVLGLVAASFAPGGRDGYYFFRR